nr:MAG TPA: hypothetical protein [Caudoviricetes sp.]
MRRNIRKYYFIFLLGLKLMYFTLIISLFFCELLTL